MKSSRRARFYSSATTVTYTFQDDQPTPHPRSRTTIQIPINSDSPPVPITVHVPRESAAALRIQAAYRSYVVRTLVKKIAAVNSEANHLERLTQRQETVDAVRSDDRERIRMNEALMTLLLRLDSVPGADPTVRELRRRVSRRIVGLQEIVDSVSDEKVEDWGGFLRNWECVLEKMEEEVCRDRGGDELQRFCAEISGFAACNGFFATSD